MVSLVALQLLPLLQLPQRRLRLPPLPLLLVEAQQALRNGASAVVRATLAPRSARRHSHASALAYGGASASNRLARFYRAEVYHHFRPLSVHKVLSLSISSIA